MNTSAQHLAPPSASRLSGFGLAVGIHVIVAIGFASVFVVQQPKKPAPPPEVVVLKDDPLPPKPLPKTEPTDIRFTVPIVDQFPPPPIDNTLPPDRTVVQDDGMKRDPIPALPPIAQPPVTKAKVGPQEAGAVCTKMTAPVMPNVNGTGEALFRVTAATSAGRVTSLEILALRNTMDGRSLRAFKSSIESALREGYVCPGDVSFVQEFQFRQVD